MKEEIKNQYGEVYYTVEHLAEQQTLISSWFGPFVSTDDVIKGASLGLEKLKTWNVPYIMNDNTELNSPWDTANDWISEVWIPQAIEAGLRKFAHIVSKDIAGEVSAYFMKENTDNLEMDTFEMRLFTEKDEALQWLHNA